MIITKTVIDMKKVVLFLSALALICAPAQAQNILNQLKNRAKNAVERTVGNEVEKGINSVLKGNNGNKQQNQQNQQGQQQTQPAQQQQTAPAGTWDCPECGHKGNTGKFCAECGAKKPEGGASAPAPQKQSQASAPQGREVPGAVPNPYTEFDVPDNPFDVALGLPKNDNGDEPALKVPKVKQSYAAFVFPDQGPRGKEYWNAERERMYSVSYEMIHGEKRVNKMLAIVDSMAIYMIDDAKKLITKIPISAVEAAAMHDVVRKDVILNESDISSSQGRWCYSHAGATESTLEIAGHETKEVNGETTYTDLETGIVLEVTRGFAHDYTRNIHLGVFYPEIFDLPEGYTMIVQDFTEAMRKMDEIERGMQQTEETLKGMDLGNMSLEELMKLAK